MRKLIAALLAVTLLLPIIASSVAASGGSFWVFAGNAQTGAYRGFQMSAGWSGNLDGVFFTSNCLGGLCERMDDRSHSVKFDCSSMDNTDHLIFYTGYNFNGTSLTAYFKSSLCSNGVYRYEIPSTWDAVISSIKFVE